MALAGYLVLNNVRAAFVEIHTGVLVCTPQLRKTRLPPAPASSQLFQPPPVSCCNNSIANDNNNNNVADDCMDPLRLSTSSTDSTATNMSCSDAGSDDLPTGNTNNHINERFALPLLARRCMLTKHSSVVCRHKPMRGGSDCNRYTMNTITHDNNNDNDDNDNSEPAMSHCGRARVVQLSGLVVEVLDAEHELDTPLSYPFSFQVNTYTPSKRDADNNIVAGSSERVESLVLSAVDARAKALWVKRIRLWNRYGWRDTEFVHADDSDYFTLQARLLTDAPHQSYSAALSQRTPVYDSVNTNQRDNDSCSIVASSTHRPTRRRFYRAPLPTSGLGLLVPP